MYVSQEKPLPQREELLSSHCSRTLQRTPGNEKSHHRIGNANTTRLHATGLYRVPKLRVHPLPLMRQNLPVEPSWVNASTVVSIPFFWLSCFAGAHLAYNLLPRIKL